MIHFPIPSAAHSRARGQSGLQQPAAGADGNQLALLKPAAGRPLAITVTTGRGWDADMYETQLRRINAVVDRGAVFVEAFNHLSGIVGDDEYRTPLNSAPFGKEAPEI